MAPIGIELLGRAFDGEAVIVRAFVRAGHAPASPAVQRYPRRPSGPAPLEFVSQSHPRQPARQLSVRFTLIRRPVTSDIRLSAAVKPEDVRGLDSAGS
jgi:hypothetical protein